MAISYLHRVVRYGLKLAEENYEKVAVALILLSAKMNEIYPPKMSSLISKCAHQYTKDELAVMEGNILQYFGYDMCFSEITYSYLSQMLEHENECKLEDAEKLLGLAVSEK